MSREIKFRAFYRPDIDIYDEPVRFEIHREEGSGIEFVAVGDTEIRYPFDIPFLDDDWILQQYTGLKDKNGKEIYEGDIVECVNGHVGLIEWKDNDCCFNVSDYYCPSNDYPTMAFMEGQPFTVIGSIYENPELLEKDHE